MAGIDEEFDPSAPLDPFSLAANKLAEARAVADEGQTGETVLLLLDIIDTLLDELREAHDTFENRLGDVEAEVGYVEETVKSLATEVL